MSNTYAHAPNRKPVYRTRKQLKGLDAVVLTITYGGEG
jgi:hypothetical protein